MKTPSPQSKESPQPQATAHAFVTFLMLNDNYLPGALTLGYSLLKQQVSGALVCLITPGVSPQGRRALELIFDQVLEVDLIYVPHARRQERQDRPYFFTRLNALRLGRDGDLGCDFEKIIVIDADVLPIRDYDSLATLDTPAGVINERKSHFVGNRRQRRPRHPGFGEAGRHVDLAPYVRGELSSRRAYSGGHNRQGRE